MDPEQTFLRVHARLSGMLSQLLTPRIRLLLEYVYLGIAFILFALLVVMHTNFVQQPGCSSELAEINFTDAQLVQIKITSGDLWAQISYEQNTVDFQEEFLFESSRTPDMNGDGFPIFSTKFWSHWIGSGARRSKLIFRTWKNEKEFLEPQVEKTADTCTKFVPDEISTKAQPEELQKRLPTTSREAFRTALIDFCIKLKTHIFSFGKSAKLLSGNGSQIWKTAGWRSVFPDIPKLSKMLHIENLNSLLVQWLEKRNKAFEPTYLYTSEKGYFLLPEGAKARHSIRTINVTISAQNSCFGNWWQQLLINSLVGYDTILMNSLLSSPGQGYLYNYQTKEFYDLSYGHESSGPARFGDYFVTKCGVLIMSLFVFFTTTMSVSFTLRETQSRMLRFTVQLQHHARRRLPTFQLIFVHVIESLVFVPIMIGILFFLFEFYDDQLLAFLVLTLVWLCELFTMISVRTPISMQFFPRFFLLYFLVFHIYFFSYAYGFSYLAFSATAAFMQHLILYFWNRFEVPALQRFMRTRAQLQQQPGVQITSSAIYTSTLHIARVNVRNPNIVNPELGGAGSEFPIRTSRSETDSTGPTESPPTQEESDPTATRNPLQFPSTTTRQPSPISSFLLRILGGGASDGIISFLSMFRDLRDQGQQQYTQPPPPPPPQENEPVT